jgi:hypothetical protein
MEKEDSMVLGGKEKCHQEVLIVSRGLLLQESCQVATNLRGLLLMKRSRKP